MSKYINEAACTGIFVLQFIHYNSKTQMRMKYVTSSVRKGNTNNSMEKNGYVKFNT